MTMTFSPRLVALWLAIVLVQASGILRARDVFAVPDRETRIVGSSFWGRLVDAYLESEMIKSLARDPDTEGRVVLRLPAAEAELERVRAFFGVHGMELAPGPEWLEGLVWPAAGDRPPAPSHQWEIHEAPIQKELQKGDWRSGDPFVERGRCASPDV